jgi:cobalt-zinc-cadmium efflux system protein
MHAHDHDHRLTGDRKLLVGALALIGGLMVGEIVTGIVAGSLALLADAGHLISDALALGFAVVAATLAARPAQGRWTYGYRRLEILSAQANGLMLGLVGIWIVYGAIRRLVSPVDVRGGVVLVVALAAIAVNLVATALLSRASRESLNVRGAFLHVATDLVAFAGTAVAGLIVLLTGWDRVDPIAGLLVAALMFWAAFGLIRDSTRIFLEASPGNIDPEEVARAIVAVPDVREVHDLHVWTLTSGFPVLSAHVLVAPGADCHGLRRQLEVMLDERYGLEHSTLQVEHAGGTVQLGPSYRRRAPLSAAPPGEARRRA